MSFTTDSYAEALQQQVWENQGVPNHGNLKRKLESELEEDAREQKNKIFKLNNPESLQDTKNRIEHTEQLLHLNFIEELKKRDKYMDAHLSKDDITKIDKWMSSVTKTTVKKEWSRSLPHRKEQKELFDKFIASKIVYPTEISLNALNLLANKPYTYSQYTTRSKDHADVFWSGFNAKFLKEKNDLRLEQVLLIGAILDVNDDELTTCFANQLASDESEFYVVEDGESFRAFNDRVLDGFVERMHDMIIKNINVSDITNAIRTAIDYITALQFIPEGKLSASGDHAHNISCSSILTNTKPDSYIPQPLDFVVLQLPNNVLVGYDFKQDKELHINRYQHMAIGGCNGSLSIVNMLLQDEIRLNELTRQFALSLTHKPYVILEARPEGKESGDKKTKGDDCDDGIFTDKTDYEGENIKRDKHALAIQANNIKLANIYEKGRWRRKMNEQQYEINEYKRLQIIHEHAERKRKDEFEVEANHAKLLLRYKEEINKRQTEKDRLHAQLTAQSSKEMAKILEKRLKADTSDQTLRRELIAAAKRGFGTSSSALSKLVSKISTVADRTAGVLEKEPQKSDGIMSAAQIEDLTQQIPTIETMMSTLSDIVESLGMELDEDLSNDDESDAKPSTESGKKIKTIGDALETKMDNIILERLLAWQKDVSTSNQRMEILYKNIEKVLEDAHDANLPMFTTAVHERPFESSMETDAMGQFSALDMELDMEDRSGLVEELRGFINTNMPHTLKIDEDYNELVKKMFARFKKAIKLDIMLNVNAKKVEDLYSESLQNQTSCLIKLKAARAVISDLKAINSVVTKGLETATKATAKELKAVKEKLMKIQKSIADNAAKEEKKRQKFESKLDTMRAKYSEEADSLHEQIRLLQINMTKVSDVCNRQNTMYGSISEEGYVNHSRVMDEIMRRYNDLNDEANIRLQNQLDEHQRESAKQIDAINKSRKEFDPPHKFPPTGDGKRRPFEPADDDINVHMQAKEARERKIKDEYDLENKKRCKEVACAIKHSNDIFEKYNRLAVSQWNELNGPFVNHVPLENEPTIYKFDGIVRMTDIHKPMNQNSLAFLRDELQQKWDNIISSLFINSNDVTINGVTISFKSLRHTLLTYVVPCVQILYKDWFVLNGRNSGILLKSDSQNSIDSLKSSINQTPFVLNQIKRISLKKYNDGRLRK